MEMEQDKKFLFSQLICIIKKIYHFNFMFANSGCDPEAIHDTEETYLRETGIRPIVIGADNIRRKIIVEI